MDAVSAGIEAGIEGGVMEHSALRVLIPHSELIGFVIQTRRSFLELFEVYKKSLGITSGEAFFIGGILHGLDHTMMAESMPDPLFLDVDHPEWGLMAELGRFVRVGFVVDIPFLLFNRKYKNLPHPFFKEVYKRAAEKNKWFADRMDACIIK